MSWWAGMRLVAARELRERSRARSFRIVTALLLLAGLAVVIVPPLVSGSDDPVSVGIVSPAPTGLQEGLRAAAEARGVDVRVVVQDELDDRTDAQAAVDSGDLEAALVGAAGPGEVRVVVEDELGDGLAAAIGEAVTLARARAGLRAAGVEAARARELLAPVPVAVAPLDADAAEEPSGESIAVGYAAAVRHDNARGRGGLQVAQAVAEDKTGRIIEVLLASLRPGQILAGKIIGIGALGLAQLLVIGIPVMVAAFAIDAVDLPSGTGSLVIVAIAWFVVGYALYSAAFGAIGALVARQEEIGSATTPLGFLLLAGYLLAAFAGPTGFDEPLWRVLSVLPPFAPMAMPFRVAVGDVAVWEQALALGLAVGSAVALIALGGRVYRRGIVRTGPRLSLRRALRGT